MGEPAFRGAGKTEGLELWRIENMAPVKIENVINIYHTFQSLNFSYFHSKSIFFFSFCFTQVNGKFYTGDSYILLATMKKGSSLAWNIHFWLGAETSQV